MGGHNELSQFTPQKMHPYTTLTVHSLSIDEYVLMNFFPKQTKKQKKLKPFVLSLIRANNFSGELYKLVYVS